MIIDVSCLFYMGQCRIVILGYVLVGPPALFLTTLLSHLLVFIYLHVHVDLTLVLKVCV